MRRADHQAGAGGEAAAGRRVSHADQAQCIEDAGAPQHAPRAVAVGQPAGEGLRRAPHQVLQRQGEGEYFAAPLVLHAHRRQEQAEGMADAHRHADDQRGEDEHGGKRALWRRGGGICHALNVNI